MDLDRVNIEFVILFYFFALDAKKITKKVKANANAPRALPGQRTRTLDQFEITFRI
jgi:hypothetical protein